MTQDGGTELAGVVENHMHAQVSRSAMGCLSFFGTPTTVLLIYIHYIYTIYTLILQCSATIKADGSVDGLLNPLWYGRPFFCGGVVVGRGGGLRFVR